MRARITRNEKKSKTKIAIVARALWMNRMFLFFLLFRSFGFVFVFWYNCVVYSSTRWFIVWWWRQRRCSIPLNIVWINRCRTYLLLCNSPSLWLLCAHNYSEIWKKERKIWENRENYLFWNYSAVCQSKEKGLSRLCALLNIHIINCVCWSK